MIKIFFIIVMIMSLTLISTSQSETTVERKSISQTVILDIQNMTCSLCKYTIKKALQGVDGLQQVNIDYDTKTASLSFDPEKTNTKTMIRLITNAGYPAKIRPDKL